MLGNASTKRQVIPTSTSGILSCSRSTQRAVREYARRSGVPIARIVDDAMNDWLTCVGSARLMPPNLLTLRKSGAAESKGLIDDQLLGSSSRDSP
jgi:hypothetical protein